MMSILAPHTGLSDILAHAHNEKLDGKEVIEGTVRKLGWKSEAASCGEANVKKPSDA